MDNAIVSDTDHTDHHNINNDTSVVNEEVIDCTNKILVHISDDLVYTLPIIGNTFQSLLDAISNDEQLKTEWHSWQRFVLKPELYYLFIYDTEFGEYVRYRRHNPISHLSKIKIRSKLYANANAGVIGDNTSIRHTYSAEHNHVLDEPTDALVCEPQPQAHNQTNNQSLTNSDVANVGSYCRYSLNSPSAPLTPHTPNAITPSLTPLTQTKASKKVFDSTLASTSAAVTASAAAISAATCMSSSTATSNAFTRKLFDRSITRLNLTTNDSNSMVMSNVSGNAEIESDGDLYEDAPTEPLYEWTPEATANFLELCKLHRNEISNAKNLFDVKRTVWEQISRDLNSRDVGYFDPLSCRNRFSRLRSTYTNIKCYPALIGESRWPYLDMMAEIIGNIPVDATDTPLSPIKDKVDDKKGRFSYPTNHRRGSASKTTNSNTKNQEVSELYVALLNLVKKYTDDFLTGKKYETWDKIATEMNAAGYKWGGNALRGLFHRLRYGYLNVLRSVEKDEELANSSWPYFRYFHNLDLTAFKGRKAKTCLTIPNSKSRSSLQKLKARTSVTTIKSKAASLKAAKLQKRKPKYKLSKPEQIKVKEVESPVKRSRGRPRKQINDQTVNDSQNTDASNFDQINVNGNDCEVRFYEYSEDDSHENVDALNKKRIKTS